MLEFRLGLDRFFLYVKREFRFVLATFAASGIGYLGSAAAPIIVQALIDADAAFFFTAVFFLRAENFFS